MAQSPAFARIKAQVLEIVATIPPSKISTYQSIGEHLAVMPRHVAYILSQLPPNEKMVYPWHRVVSGDGTLGVAKKGPDGKTQAEMLRDEGILVSQNSIATEMTRVLVLAQELPSGIGKQTRPADAPVGKPRNGSRKVRAT
jgi:methylated-DNA-protein-cysteine methyltransferase related protein